MIDTIKGPKKCQCGWRPVGMEKNEIEGVGGSFSTMIWSIDFIMWIVERGDSF